MHSDVAYIHHSCAGAVDLPRSASAPREIPGLPVNSRLLILKVGKGMENVGVQ